MPKHLVDPKSSLARSTNGTYQVQGANNKLTSNEAQALLGRAAQLGLNIAAFERRCGFRPGRLRPWAKHFAATARANEAQPSFVRVAVKPKATHPADTNLSPVATPIRLIVGDITLEISNSFSKNTLLQLLDLLESRS